MKLLPEQPLREVTISIFNPDETSLKAFVDKQQWYKERQQIAEGEKETLLTPAQRLRSIRKMEKAISMLRGDPTW